MLAFGLQALVSLILSIAAKFLENPRRLKEIYAEQLTIQAMVYGSMYDIVDAIFHNITASPGQVTEVAQSASISPTNQLKQEIKTALSARLDHWLYSGDSSMTNGLLTQGVVGDSDGPNAVTAAAMKLAAYKKKQELICKILLVASDVQTVTGEYRVLRCWRS